MKALICAAALVASAAFVSADETKLGAGVTLKDATPIKLLIEKPADYVGKTVRVDGIATAVCEEMGCWMSIAPEGDAKAATVRVKVEDGAITIPVTAKGKKVSAEGVFEEIGASDGHGQEAAGEHAKTDPKASKTYQLKGTGVVIK
jgi:hypothetical protein